MLHTNKHIILLLNLKEKEENQKQVERNHKLRTL